jgi:hypothetical protein
MTNKHWNHIVQFYKETFNVNEETLDLVADFDVLDYCAKGIGNKDIATILSMPEDEVISIIVSYYGFLGFPTTLDYNVYSLYKENRLFDPIEKKMCLIYEGLRERMDEYESS